MLAKGYLHCTPYGYATGSFTGADTLSVVFKTDANFAQSNKITFFNIGGYGSGFAAQVGDDGSMRIFKDLSTIKAYYNSAIAAKATKDINVFCVVFKKDSANNADCALYVNGEIITPRAEVVQTYPTFGAKYILNNFAETQSGATDTNILYQDFMIFNFDIFADGAPYTYTDYANGNLVPLALKDTTAVNRALLMLENYTILNGSSRFIPDVSSNGQDATVKTEFDGTISGDADISIAKLKEYLTANT